MTDHTATLAALTALETGYWYDVDHHWGRSAHTLYTADGVFAIGDKRMAGPAEIQAFYAWREGRGQRTARHVISNMRVVSHGAARATLECIMCLYAADGAPVLASRPPIMIADVTGDCVLDGDGDGAWRYRSHLLRPLFMGGEAPTIPPGP